MDPLFADTLNRDFHLTEDSPCIDAGDPDSPRDPDQTIADIGRYYFDQSAPLISVSESLLDFGEVTIGNHHDLDLTVYNHGTDTLNIISVTSDSSVFTNDYNPANSSILPNNDLVISVTFTPADTGIINDTLFIINNDSLIKVNLKGIGKNPTGIIENDLNIQVLFEMSIIIN